MCEISETSENFEKFRKFSSEGTRGANFEGGARRGRAEAAPPLLRRGCRRGRRRGRRLLVLEISLSTSGRLDIWTSGHPYVRTSARPNVQTSGCLDVQRSEDQTSGRPDVRASGCPHVRTSCQYFAVGHLFLSIESIVEVAPQKNSHAYWRFQAY